MLTKFWVADCYNLPVIWSGKQNKVKKQSKTVTLKNEHTHTHTPLPDCVLCSLPVASPVSDLYHKGRFHIYLATVDDGAVGEWTVVPVSCLQFYGVDHCLMREKETHRSLLTSNYDEQEVKSMWSLKALMGNKFSFFMITKTTQANYGKLRKSVYNR